MGEEKPPRLALVPSVLLSYLLEQGTADEPMYVKTPVSLVAELGGEHMLVYPYEWTEEQARLFACTT